MYFLTLLFSLLFAFLSNNYITVTKHLLNFRSKKNQSHSLSILHISDLHNKNFGIRQSYLIKKIQSLHPDILVITGDIVDHASFKNAAVFIQKASHICPIFYARGNHESTAGNYVELEKELFRYHVEILKNTSAIFTKDGMVYQIAGLDDPEFYGYRDHYSSYMHKSLYKILKQTDNQKADYHILLSHRPELFHLYSKYPFELVLCGHAHGGQFRPPFTDGLYAPNQGIFPKYTSGAHMENGTTQIISRGLGNSTFPLRLFNFPEIVQIIIR